MSVGGLAQEVEARNVAGCAYFGSIAIEEFQAIHAVAIKKVEDVLVEVPAHVGLRNAQSRRPEFGDGFYVLWTNTFVAGTVEDLGNVEAMPGLL